MNSGMKHIAILIVAGFLTMSCHSQKSILTEKTSDIEYLIRGQYRSIHIDKLDFTYLVTEANEIIKLDKDYQVLFRFSISRLGSIASIDVSNPQKILVYYPEYYNIVFLDNTLSEIKRLNLESLEYWDVSATALSRENLIWLFNPVNQRLLKIDEQGKLFNSSSELYSEGIDVNSDLNILSYREQVYLYNQQSIWVFDNFGQFLKRIDLSKDKIQFVQDEMIYSDKNKISRYSLAIEFSDPSKALFHSANDIHDFILLPAESTLLLLDKNGVYLKSL